MRAKRNHVSKMKILKHFNYFSVALAVIFAVSSIKTDESDVYMQNRLNSSVFCLHNS